ncbi:putative spermidine/putrescine transport system substrate-binding protein [Bradyrhizobium sp. LB7.2]
MKTSLMITSALAATGLIAGMLAPTKPALAGDQLTIVSWGGAGQRFQRLVYFEPFSKATGIKITEGEYSGEVAKIRAMVQSKSVSWDVVDSGPPPALLLCDEGLLETIDWKKVGVDRANFGDAGKFDCGLPISISATVVAYDKDKLPNGPTKLADLFDLQKFPGKRGLWKNPYPNLEWALIADGVPIKDVYQVLKTPAGVDRAFTKLDTIKKDVIWWTNAEPMQLLADGQVVMTASWSGRVIDANKSAGKNFAILWDAAQQNRDYWVIPKGTPRLQEAYKFLAFSASAEAQAKLSNLSSGGSGGPGNKEALKLVDPAVLPNLPNTPDREAISLTKDDVFWAEKGDELRQRFTAWLGQVTPKKRSGEERSCSPCRSTVEL